MVNKRAQGLPLSFIVIAAIAVLILVIVVAFVIFGLGGSFKGITTQTASELETVQVACQTNCNKLQTGTTKTISAFKSSQYCTKTYTIDMNGDGEINTDTESGTKEISLKCWDDIGISCSVTLQNSTVLTGSDC